MSIVSEWQKKYPFGKQEEGIEKLNKVCGGKRRSSELSAIKRGERPLSECYHWMMLNECLEDILTEHGYTRDKPMPSVEWTVFLDKLCPPKRKKP